MIEGWQFARVEEVCKTVSVGIVIKPAQYYVEQGEGVRAFRSANIGENRVINRDWVYLSHAGHEANRKSALRAGDVLVVRSGAPGTACVVPPEYAGSNCIDVVFARPDREHLVPEYLAEYTNSDVGKRHITGTQGGLALKHFNVGAFKQLELLLPPLPEQRKIAEILRTWDEAIEKLQALRAAKERRLDALRQRLLFPAEADGIDEMRIGDVTAEETGRNGDSALGRETVMGVTNSRGVVPMRPETIAADIRRYKHFPPDAFAYNPMRINVGSIARNEAADTLLVSPDYVVFSCAPDGLLPGYLDHLRYTKWWLHHINSGGSGSVRQRTYYADLAALHLPIPGLNRQRAVVETLETARADVDGTGRMIDALTQQKRGLMQKLLTGEWRVKGLKE